MNTHEATPRSCVRFPNEVKADEPFDVPASHARAASVHVFSEDEIQAIEAALATQRPLLLRGEPGVGKSQLAHAAAAALKWPIVVETVSAHTEARDLLYSIDHVERLARAQLLRAGDCPEIGDERSKLKLTNFIRPGPLWWGMNFKSARTQARRVKARRIPAPDEWSADTGGVVVLLDEMDKSDGSVPNALLAALGDSQFDVPGRAAVQCRGRQAPLIIVTTNEERSLPDAFIRRCWVLPLELPSNPEELRKTLIARGRAHLKFERGDVMNDEQDAVTKLLETAADMLIEDRTMVTERGHCPPGQAEYLDLVRAVTQLESRVEKQLERLEKLRRFALNKHVEEVSWRS